MLGIQTPPTLSQNLLGSDLENIYQRGIKSLQGSSKTATNQIQRSFKTASETLRDGSKTLPHSSLKRLENLLETALRVLDTA